MTQNVVDAFKPVYVRHHDRKGFVTVQKRFKLRHQATAVEKPCQRIMKGQMVRSDRSLILRRDVQYGIQEIVISAARIQPFSGNP